MGRMGAGERGETKELGEIGEIDCWCLGISRVSVAEGFNKWIENKEGGVVVLMHGQGGWFDFLGHMRDMIGGLIINLKMVYKTLEYDTIGV